MALDRDRVLDAAWHILQDYGLGDLSMRRLARELGVQPGALYWHVANKQELLAVLARRMVAPLGETPAGAQGPALLTTRFRSLVLAVRDGADVVSVAHALDPLGMQPVPLLVAELTAQGLPPEGAETTALTLVRFTLGSVTAQQTRESMDLPTATMAAEFEAGVRAILA
ncbi:TetR family transcriptional regulator [Kocuria sp.]|uniref:TetR family transcriptional regulator n=1 Tax=Kocuria sp. TaxID=1871328 RepID=UPI0026DBFA17|nr:TetR family transcriptional regulator [Kocuria sp.]MDO4918097.1 TetR family transcriptional regulator [Kocuria sp.]